MKLQGSLLLGVRFLRHKKRFNQTTFSPFSNLFLKKSHGQAGLAISMELAVQDSNVSFGSVIGSNFLSLSIYEIKKCILQTRNSFFAILRVNPIIRKSEKLLHNFCSISAPPRNIVSVNEISDFVVKPNILLISNISTERQSN